MPVAAKPLRPAKPVTRTVRKARGLVGHHRPALSGAERFRAALDLSADQIFLSDPHTMRMIDCNATVRCSQKSSTRPSRPGTKASSC
jgi:hypothetical protein